MLKGANALRPLFSIFEDEIAIEAKELACDARRSLRQYGCQIYAKYEEGIDCIGAHFVKLGALGRVLHELPRLRLIESLIDQIGDPHYFAHHFPEFTVFVRLRD